MCGVFGFISTSGKGPNLRRLRKMAQAVQPRGLDAWGLVIHDNGDLLTHKQPGLLSENLEMIDIARDCKAILGHVRAATSGDPLDNENNHPHRAGTGYFIHNGVIRNHVDLIRKFALKSSTDCDSEVIGLIHERQKTGRHVKRIRKAVSKTIGTGLVVAGMWRKALVLIRCEGRPLCIGETPRGIYFSSVLGGLPKKAYKLDGCRSFDWTFIDGQFVYRGEENVQYTRTVSVTMPVMPSHGPVKRRIPKGSGRRYEEPLLFDPDEPVESSGRQYRGSKGYQDWKDYLRHWKETT